MTNDELIAQAELIAADCNQLASARSFAREAAAALGEMEAERDQAKRNLEYLMAATDDSDDATLVAENCLLMADKANLEQQLREQSEARRVAIERLRVTADWCVDNRGESVLHVPLSEALAILTPTTKVRENAAKGHGEAVEQPVETSK